MIESNSICVVVSATCTLEQLKTEVIVVQVRERSHTTADRRDDDDRL